MDPFDYAGALRHISPNKPQDGVPDTGMGNGTRLDDSYQTALADRENQDSLSWLMQDEPGKEPKPGEGKPQAEGEAPAEDGGVLDTAKAVGSDVLTGVTSDAANVVVGGPMKALQETLGLLDPLVRAIDANTPLGAISEAVGLENFGEPNEDGTPKEATLPNIGGAMDRPESVTGSILQGITQFLTGFGMAGKVVKGAGTAATLGKAAISDFAAFDGQEGNLANLIQMAPALQNPITEYLSTDDQTGEVEGRLKNTLANFVPSAIIEPAIMGLRALREARRVKALTGGDTYEEAAARLAKTGGEAQPQAAGKLEGLLGNPSDDLVRTVDTALAQTETGVPDHVAAKSLAEAKGAHKAEDVPAGMKRLYTVERADGTPRLDEAAVLRAGGVMNGQTPVFKDLLVNPERRDLRKQIAKIARFRAPQEALETMRFALGSDGRIVFQDGAAGIHADLVGERPLLRGFVGKDGKLRVLDYDSYSAEHLEQVRDRLVEITGNDPELMSVGYFRQLKDELGAGGFVETDDLATAQAAIKAEGGKQGETHQIVFRDVPVERASANFTPQVRAIAQELLDISDGNLDEAIETAEIRVHSFDVGNPERAEAEQVVRVLREDPTSFNESMAADFTDGVPDYMQGYAADIEKMFPPDVDIRWNDRIERGGREVAGGYLNKTKTLDLTLAHGPGELMKTAQHEAVHALRYRKLFKDDEWRALYDYGNKTGVFDAASRKRYADRDTKLLKARGASPEAIRTIIDDVAQEETVARVVENSGRLPPEIQRVVDRIISGEVAARSPLGPRPPRAVSPLNEHSTAATGGGGSAEPPSAPPVAPDKGPPFSREVFVNWARIDTPDDVKRVLGQMADAFAPEIAAKQRGVRTNAQTADAAGQENAWKLLIGERKGNLPNAEETLALRQLYTASGEKLLEVSKLAMTGDAEASFAFRRMMAVHNMIQQEVMGIRTETARALQQWRIPAGGGAEKLKQLEFALRNHGGLEVTQALAQRIAILADQPGGAAAIDQIVKKGAAAKTMDAVREIWINAILSGPKTHIVNMMSNSAVIGQSIIERAVAGRIGHILNPVDGVKMGEATAMQFGVRMAYRDALRNAWKTLQTGESGFGMGQIEGPRTRAISSEATGVNSDSLAGRGIDMIGSVVNIPGRALTASDEFFKSTNYRAELWAQAYRTASEEVERGTLKPAKLKERIADIINDPPEDIRLKAADMAAYNTFTSNPGPISQKLMQFRNTLDDATGTPIGTMLMPFINTPGNIMKYTFERTPLAPLMSRFRADVAAGGARRDLALARMGLGSITLAVALDMAMDGHITGRGPAGTGNKDAGQRQAQARIGWQKYSIRVPTKYRNGKPVEFRYYAFNRADPVGGQLAMAAELAEAINNSDGTNLEGVSEVLSALVLSNAQIYMNKSYFSGITKFIDAVTDPERYGESYFNSLAESFVPTGIAEAARFVDPVQRHVTNMTDGLMKRTPGLSSSLPPRLDFWGKPIEYGSGLGPVYDALSPIYSKSTETAEPIDKEFFKLNYFPTHAKTIDVAGGKVNLRNMPKAYNRLIELTASTKASTLLSDENDDALREKKGGGAKIWDLQTLENRTLKEALNGIVTGTDDALVEHFVKKGSDTESYFEADTDEKQQIIKDVISAYRSAATLQVVREFPEISERRALQPTRDEAAPGLPY